MFLQAPPTLGNQYDQDRPLRAYLRRVMPAEVLAAVEPSLRNMGELAAGPLLELSQRHRLDLPRHVPYDPWGRRVDEIELSPSWRTFAEVAAREGLVATAYERKSGAFSRLHQFALVYLFDRSTQVYTCPLAMTDGCARSLELHGSPELKARVLPRLLSRDPARSWTSGQWMTERIGGSDVGLSETVARQTEGGWRLYGVKWFTSAVTSEVALTLARPEGGAPGGKGLALFFVDVRDAQGHLNGITVHRLKDKLGTRHLPTAELTLDGTLATPLVGLTDGVKHMSSMLNLTRTWNTVCSAAGLRRGLALAREYARLRVAFGHKLSEKPLHLEVLADLAAEQEGAMLLAMHVARRLGEDEAGALDERGRAVLRLLHPVAKLTTAKQAVTGSSEIVESFGGAGYVEDTGLPELYRDAQVLSIWEGTTNVLSLEACRAIARTQALEGLVAEVRGLLGEAKDSGLKAPVQTAAAGLERAVAFWEKHAASGGAGFEAGARGFAMTLGRVTELALLCSQAQWALDVLRDGRTAAAARRFAARGVDCFFSAPDLVGSADSRALGMDEPL